MYPQSFSAAEKVDFAFYYIFGLSILVLVLITIVMIYFVIRYNKNRHPEAAQIHGSLIAELIWTIIPSILIFGMFYYGWTSYTALRTVPKGAMEINVKSRMWSWKFEYPNGKSSNKLYIPINKAVKLNITASDVIHSFYVPAFRIKIDAVPGMTTYTWLESDHTGTYDIFCAEYCGLKHSDMLSTVTIMEQEEYDLWYSSGKEPSTTNSAEVILENYGCLDCHSTDGEELVGPTFKDIFNRKTVILKNGEEITIITDRDYLRRAILDPEIEMVKDYEPMMPPFEGEIAKDELEIILDYFENPNTKSILDGRQIIEEEGCMDCHSTDGSIIAGPSFKNIINRKTVVIENYKEKEIHANKSYIIESIVDPEQKIVKDFDSMMSPYDTLTSEQIDAIVKYFESISTEQLDIK